jgi:hypothetical protein
MIGDHNLTSPLAMGQGSNVSPTWQIDATACQDGDLKTFEGFNAIAIAEGLKS